KLANFTLSAVKPKSELRRPSVERNRYFDIFPGFFMCGTRLIVRTLGTRARNETGEVVTGRRPNVDKRRRGSNGRPHRPLDSSAIDSVLSRNLSLSKHVGSRSQ